MVTLEARESTLFAVISTLPLPTAVGVPEMVPSCARDSPPGRVPLVSAKVARASAAASLCEYALPT